MIYFVVLKVSVSNCYLNTQVIHSKILTPLDSREFYFMEHQDYPTAVGFRESNL